MMESSLNAGSASTSKSTDSFTRTDSISINLPSSNNIMNKLASCEHFCMRKYVSDMRKKDQTACWPFDVPEVPTYTLPPLEVPRFLWWNCGNCLLEPVTETDGTVQKTSSCKCKSGSPCTHDLADDSETAELVTKFTHMVSLDMAEIRKSDDVSVSVEANGNKSHASVCTDGEAKDQGIDNLIKVPKKISKDAVHHDLPSRDAILAQVDAFSGQEQGTDARVGNQSQQKNDYPCPNAEHNRNLEVSNIAEYRQIQVKASRSDQQMKLMGSCQASDTINTLTTENEQNPYEEELDGHDSQSSDSTEICPGSRNKSGRLQRRKVHKVRLLADLLGEKVNSNAEHSRTRDSPSFAVLDVSEEDGIAKNVKKGFHGQKRKRNFSSDEELQTEETVIPNKEVQKVEIVRGNATNPEAVVGSALDKDGFVKISSDSAMKSGWMNYRYNASNGILKKKLKTKEKNNQIVEQSFQSKESELRSKAVPMAAVGLFVENDASRGPASKTIVRIDRSKLGDDFATAEKKEKKKKKNKVYDEPFQNKVGESRFKAVSNPIGSLTPEGDALLSRETESLFNSELKMGSKSCVCKKKSKAPHIDDYDQLGSRIPLSKCMTQESQVTRNDSGTIQIGSAAIQLPNYARLKNETDPPSIGTKFTTQLECGVSRQESAPKEDKLLKKFVKPRYPEPNILSTSRSSDPLRKGQHANKEIREASYGMPFMSDKQTYVSQSKDGTRSVTLHKDVPGVSTKRSSQDEEAVKSKSCSEVADAAPAPAASDDIPMEIVELMAKIQHDNRLYDAAKSKKLNSSLHKQSTVKEQVHSKNTKHGITTAKRKTVSFSPQVSGKPQISKSHGAFSLYHQEVGDSVPVRHRSSGGAIDNTKEAVRPWSSAMFVNSPPQERVKILDFKSANPEKNHHKDFHLEQPPPYYPPKQNGLKLQNQFGPTDIYSNEKIPAMHLLSLMDAGRQSGQIFEKQQQQPLPQGHRPKEVTQSGGYPLSAFAGMNFSAYDKMAERLNRASVDYRSRDYLSATRDRQSPWLLEADDDGFRRRRVVKAHEKGKRKLEGSSSSSTAQKSVPVQNPMILHTEKKKLKSNIIDWSPRSGSQTEVLCTVNRNPADFSAPELGNSYMIRGKEIKYDSRRRSLRLFNAQENMEHETKRQLTAAALLAELQIM